MDAPFIRNLIVQQLNSGLSTYMHVPSPGLAAKNASLLDYLRPPADNVNSASILAIVTTKD